MPLQKCLVIFALFLAGSLVDSPAQVQNSSALNVQQSIGNIEGSVRTSENSPVGDANIELESIGATRLPSTYSLPDGSFVLINVPSGRYVISATLGTMQISEQININAGENSVILTIPSKEKAGTGTATVSAAQLKVPNQARNALQKAWTAVGHKKTAEAARYLEKALTFWPRYSQALTLRAMLELHDNSKELARTDAEKAVEYDPNDGTAYIALGSAYNALHQYDDAIRTLDRAITLSPTAWEGYYEMSRALLAEGNWAVALRQAERASSMGQRNNPNLHLAKAYAYLQLNNKSEASTELEAFRRLKGDGPVSSNTRHLLDQLELSLARK
jgi:tetratricopeptide (TPR) repeat protein